MGEKGICGDAVWSRHCLELMHVKPVDIDRQIGHFATSGSQTPYKAQMKGWGSFGPP